ncbi:hypothetical protein [Pseudomonas sp. F01002]|uniref:hypothetical protein n=1 Tax=Pseudomonas sp. F01002 TaxID=2555724 RepID=UPI00106B56AB|nr:hypothetical protein [Pseudomonas sp. F01002]TFB41513.1 hypothetical protein E3W21_10150 [Pseudomonas sp. F01002]
MQWLRMASILLLWAGFCRAASAADAGSSMVLANMDRTGWPDVLTSQASMDTALRADLRQLAAAFTGEISPAHAIWASKSQVFHEQALNEQLRVAVLAP